MQILAGIVILVVIVFVLVPLMSSKKTRLFRRIWSSERVGGSYGHEKQQEALGQLLSEFGVDFRSEDDEIKSKMGDLLAAATEFDVRNQRNMGVQVMPVLARRLSMHRGLQARPDIVADLKGMSLVDGVGLHNALMQSIPEVTNGWQQHHR